MKTYWIETYGCQMNKAESESLALRLIESGWSEAHSSDDSDVVIINTCSVRKTAEERAWGRIGFYGHAKNPGQKLVITGCMAERLKDDIIRRAPAVDMVIGNFNKHRMAEYLEDIGGGDAKNVYAGAGDYLFSPMHCCRSFRAFLPISHGCDNFCTYCIVPYVRGREVSRGVKEILVEVDSLLAKGVKEITLLGQNVNSYRYENGRGIVRFVDLLEAVSARTAGAARIRFLTSHPKDFVDELADLISERENICNHIHLPIQHASDAVLKRMNRRYDMAYIRRLVRKVRERIPAVSITTDILIGFPGETEKDFNTTLEALRELDFDDAFTYRYNPREGTAAFTMQDEVPENEKLRRLDAVIRLQRSISFRKKERKLGTIVKVLAEDVSKKNPAEILARTEQDEMVVFPGRADTIGRFARVELAGLNGNTFMGKERS
jgi:tRNA-2-methylthio-N6-dimethylallyladenosine synthase